MAFGLVLSLVDRFTSPIRNVSAGLTHFTSTVKQTAPAAAVATSKMVGITKATQAMAPSVDRAANSLARLGREARNSKSGKDALGPGKAATKDWGKIGGAVAKAGVKVAGVGAVMTAAGAQARGMASDFVAPFEDYEQSLALIRTVTPATFGSVQADIDQLRLASKAWAGEHTDSAVSFTRASYMMLSSGLDMKAAIAGTSTALTVSKATMGDASQTASALATLYSNLGNKAAEPTQEMGRLGDVLARTQQLFKFANLGQLTEGLKFGMPVAKQYGMSVEQLSSAIGTLNDVGIEGGMAGTTFGAVMRNMNKASKSLGFELARTADGGVDFAGTIAAMQKKFGDKLLLPKTQQALQDAFGDEGVKGVTLLMGKVARMEGALGDLNRATGTAAAAQRTMESTGAASWQRFRNAVDNAKISLAEGFAPTIESTAARLKELVDGFSAFAAAHPGLVSAAGKLMLYGTVVASILGPVVLAFGSVASAIGGVVKAISWLAGKGVFVKIAIAAKAAFAAVKAAVLAAIPAVRAFFMALVTNPITWIILGIATAVFLLIRYWDQIGPAVSRAAAWIWNALAPVRTWLSNLWRDVVNTFWAAINGIHAGLARVSPWLADLFLGIVSWLAELPGRMFASGAALFTSFLDGMKSTAGQVVAYVGEVLDAVRQWLPFSDAKVGPLSNLTASGQAFVSTWGEGVATGSAEVPAIMERFGRQLDVPGGQGVSAGGPGQATQVRLPSQQPSRQVVIHGLTINVQAADVAEAESFTGMIQGLAEGYG
jgi:TP901 family phage tail tape measure protein